MPTPENKPGLNVSSQEEIKNPASSPEGEIETANEKKLSDTIEQSSSKVFLVSNEAKKVTPSQKTRIEENGGSETELSKKTAEVDQKIETVNAETNQKVMSELMTQLNDWKAKMEKGSKSAPRAIKYTVDEVTKFCQKNGLPIPQEILDATPVPKEKPAKAEQSKVFKNAIPGPVEDVKSNTNVEIPVAEQPVVEKPKNEEFSAEKIKNGISFLKDMYTSQAESVNRAMNEYYSAEKEFGVDNSVTQEKKKIWDTAFNARSETGAKIAEWIKDFPEYKDMFKADEQFVVEKPITEQPTIEKQPIIPVEQKSVQVSNEQSVKEDFYKGLKRLTTEEAFSQSVENAMNIRDLTRKLNDLGDITAPDGYVYKKDDLIKIITELKGAEDPNLQKITRMYGLREKVKEMLESAVSTEQPIIETPKFQEGVVDGNGDIEIKTEQRDEKNKREAQETFDKAESGSLITIKNYKGELKQVTVVGKDTESGKLIYEETEPDGKKGSYKVDPTGVLDMYTPKKPKEEPKTKETTEEIIKSLDVDEQAALVDLENIKPANIEENKETSSDIIAALNPEEKNILEEFETSNVEIKTLEDDIKTLERRRSLTLNDDLEKSRIDRMIKLYISEIESIKNKSQKVEDKPKIQESTNEIISKLTPDEQAALVDLENIKSVEQPVVETQPTAPVEQKAPEVEISKVEEVKVEPKNPEPSPVKATEKINENLEKARADYVVTQEKINGFKQQIKGIEDTRKELISEREDAKRNGDTKKAEEIQKKIDEKSQEINTIKESKEGLNEQKNKSRELKGEFKKQHGYDTSLDKEARDRFGIKTDANRAILNNYLGLELPILTRDLKTEKVDGKEYIINDRSEAGYFNRSFLVEKQLKLMEDGLNATRELKKLTEEQKEQLMKLADGEYALDLDALKEMEFNSGSRDQSRHWEDKNINDIFNPFLKTRNSENSKNYGEIIYGNGLSQKTAQKLANSGYKDYYDLSLKGSAQSGKITNTLVMYKIAKEKGFI